jgi:hypothetical protein
MTPQSVRAPMREYVNTCMNKREREKLTKYANYRDLRRIPYAEVEKQLGEALPATGTLLATRERFRRFRVACAPVRVAEHEELFQRRR